jgi:hypothetical protein
MNKFLQHNWPILFAVAFAAGCGDAPSVRRFDAEYDWSKPSRKTADLGIQVTFPSWLAAGDQDKVLAVVDSYARGIITKYPHAGAFWWGSLRVYLHEAVGEKIVCYYPAIWCWGWQLGRRVYTPWRPVFDAGTERIIIGIHPEDTFMVIPHEVFHLIGGWEVGSASVDNAWIEANPLAQEAISYSRSHAKRLELSEESIRGALAKLPYVPWIEPEK